MQTFPALLAISEGNSPVTGYNSRPAFALGMGLLPDT